MTRVKLREQLDWRWWLLLLGMALAAPALYHGSSGVDTKNHNRVLDAFIQLEKQQYQLDSAVLLNLSGATHNYDSLSDAEREVERKIEGLQKSLFGHRTPSTEFHQYHALSLTKLHDVERFKSHFALLRNSLSYLRLLTGNMQEKTRHDPVDSTVHSLLIELSFDVTALSHSDMEEEEELIEELKGFRLSLPAEGRGWLDDIIVHAESVLGYTGEVHALVVSLRKDELTLLLKQIKESYLADYNRRAGVAAYYRLALLCVTIALVLTVLVMLLMLRGREVKLVQALNQVEFQQHALDEHAIVSIADVNGDILYANDKFCAVSGYRRDELIGHNHRIIKSNDHPDSFYSELWQTISQGKVWQGEVKNRKKDGSCYWVMSTVVPQLDNNGIPFEYISVRTDITKLKAQEEALNKQQMQVATLNQAQTLFIYYKDPVVFFSALLLDVLELAKSEFGFFAEVKYDEANERYLKVYAATNIAWDEATNKLYDEQAREGFEFHNLNNLFGHVILDNEVILSNNPKEDPRSGGIPEGHPELHSFIGIPIRLGTDLVGMVGLANRPGGFDESIVELLEPILNTCGHIFDSLRKERLRQEAEEELTKAKMVLQQQAGELKQAASWERTLTELLRLSQQLKGQDNFLYQSLMTLCTSVPWLHLQQSGAIFLTAEEDGRQVLKLAATYNLAQPLHQLCATVPFGHCLCGRAAQEQTIQHAQCVDERHDITFEGIQQHGHYCVPLLSDDTLYGVMALYLDHGHELDATEETFLQQVGDIISVAINRYHLLDDLRNAKELAEAAAVAKSQFLATMSHEIRTPMNGVLGMLQLLDKTEMTPKQQSFLSTASTSGELLLTVINDILDYSKMEAGKLILESIPFDPLTLAEETSSLLAGNAHDKGIELIVNLDPALPHLVRGDPVRLRQILTNLLGNAIKFTEQGEVVVKGEYKQNRLIFSVIDTGIGLDEEQQQRLFQSFSQADSSHTRRFGGTGLGLAITKRLVEAMDGEIEVSSCKGEGSTFTVSLPMRFIEIDKVLHDADILRCSRILIVDDNRTNLEVLINILKSWEVGHVVSAEGAEQACDLLKEASERGEPFDLAILDMQMPSVDGAELSESIRKKEYLYGIKIIMFSSIDVSEDEQLYDALLFKPLQQSDLYNTMISVLGGETRDNVPPLEQADTDELWFSNRPLLLVEDNHVNQAVAYEILSDAGFKVDICDNGAKAVSRVQEVNYDVVMMDIQMPVMDGLEATRKIRALGNRFTPLPIIAMTANALADDAGKSLDAGMTAHVTKPIDANHVLRTIAQWVAPDPRPEDAMTIETATDAQLPELPGIDVKEAVVRMRGNWTAYERVLKGFREKQADSAEHLTVYLNSNNWEEAIRLAHSLKGSGGNIGAALVYQHAAALEQACKAQDKDSAEQHLAQLIPVLDEVISGLKLLDELNAQNDQTTEISLDAEGIHAKLIEILPLLDSNIAEAQGGVERLRKMSMGGEWQDRIEELENTLNSFDIDAARIITEQLIQQLKDTI